MFVELVEVSARDGLQNEKVALPARVRAELVTRAVDAGLPRVEAVSFVDPDRVPQMAHAEQVLGHLDRPVMARCSALVLNEKGMQRAVEVGIGEVNYVLVATDAFSRRNQGVGVESALEAWHRVAEIAHANRIRPSLTVAAAFGCPFTGEVPIERVVELARAAAVAAPHEIAVADTIGVATPDQVTALLGGIAAELPDIRRRCHFHNTRNTGYANAVAAVAAGAQTLDASIGGVGGCPFAPNATGNIATEDLLYLLHRMGHHTRAGAAVSSQDGQVDLESVVAAAEWLGRLLGIEVPALLGRAGPFPPVRPASRPTSRATARPAIRPVEEAPS